MRNQIYIYLCIYLLIINLTSFTLFFLDKRKAKKDKWRIKENTLHLFSFLGGAFGSIVAMFLFHHKTKKVKFCVITTIAAMINFYVIYKVFTYFSKVI